MLRLIHTADWQLGKPYRRFDSDVRVALSEARFDAIDAVGKAAVEHGASHVLVAGDVFDTEGPEDRVIVQAVSRMQRYACTWWLLPGNHDFARNSGLWDRVRTKGAANIRIVAEPVPRELEPGHWLLPAPLMHRHNLDDPTALLDTMETPGATLRIGLAQPLKRSPGGDAVATPRIDHRHQLCRSRPDHPLHLEISQILLARTTNQIICCNCQMTQAMTQVVV